MNQVKVLAVVFCFAILAPITSAQDGLPKKSSVPLPSEKAMSIIATKLLPIISPNVELYGKAEVTNPQWTFVNDYNNGDGKKWQLWKVTGYFSYPTGQRIREFHQFVICGDEVSTPTQLSWGGLFENLAKRRMNPTKEISEKDLKSAEQTVVRKFSNAEFRRINIDRTIRSLIEEEAEKQAEKKTR